MPTGAVSPAPPRVAAGSAGAPGPAAFAEPRGCPPRPHRGAGPRARPTPGAASRRAAAATAPSPPRAAAGAEPPPGRGGAGASRRLSGAARCGAARTRGDGAVGPRRPRPGTQRPLRPARRRHSAAVPRRPLASRRRHPREMATEPPRPAPPAAGRPEGGRGRCAGGGRGEAEEAAAAQAALGASPGPAAAAAAAAGGRRRGLNGCVPLSHQVAGHMYGKDKGGILQHPDGTVLKQLQPPPRGPREQEFYNKVYHVSSDSYETQNQHYGRSLTKETVRDGISKFFHNGCCLRKDAIAASIQKIEKILAWFEGQKQLNFYASSLLFVYEGSCQATTVRLSDVTLAEKRGVPKGLLSGGDILEYNNNIHVINSTENGKIEASVSKGLSKFYALHKKAYAKRHHSQLSLKVENLEQDNVWKSSTCITQEHLNGNVIPQLEKVFCHMPAEIKESANVEVRMIDFAHVFPSNTKDEGYIYGLKNLITVLQNILDN
ncbi:inositol polyphosphate multikinase isoform 2-T4 [Alca torda]